jgi:hypothetical protein
LVDQAEIRQDIAGAAADVRQADYGIALPAGSPLRERVDRVLLDDVHSDWWQHLLFSYVGMGA